MFVLAAVTGLSLDFAPAAFLGASGVCDAVLLRVKCRLCVAKATAQGCKVV